MDFPPSAEVGVNLVPNKAQLDVLGWGPPSNYSDMVDNILDAFLITYILDVIHHIGCKLCMWEHDAAVLLSTPPPYCNYHNGKHDQTKND